MAINIKIRKIWRDLRRISVNLCGNMVWLLISRLHLLPFTVYATLDATWQAEIEFGNSHGKNNLANAYKHAAWNALIAYHVQKFYHNAIPALAWAKKVTDMHEECFVNHPAAKAMDLKNNEIGREIYQDLFEKGKIEKSSLLKAIRKEEKLVFLE